MNEKPASFAEIRKTLGQINGNIPSFGFLAFWLGAVPVIAVVAGLAIAIWRLSE